MIGQIISHYRILEKLGEGGMGVVYKAEDTKLERAVALKFLAPHLLRDEEGEKRFHREAKAAASLDHPNICAVHEIDQVDGRTFIVMPLLEGRPLSKRIAEGPLKLAEALSIAAQVVEGLDAAHQKGVVHRDIKPDNLMLAGGSRGVVKILDFGLAHLGGSSKLTRDGTTLGTAAYMSPEQVAGGETDRRSDFWSLGVVLYEMVAGTRPFQGESDQALIYAILNHTPEPLSAVRTGVPKDLERVVAKCLSKKPEQRYQHAADLLVDLEALRRDPGSQPDRAAPASRAKRMSRYLAGGAAAAVVVALGLAWWLGRSSVPPAGTALQYNLTQLTRDTGDSGSPSISPNGQLIAYASDRGSPGNLDIWVKQVAGGDPIQLTNSLAQDGSPSFSPDSSHIVFASYMEGGGIFVIPALGGSARRVADWGLGPRFSPDGKWISFSTSSESGNERRGKIYIVPASGGTPRLVEAGLQNARRPVWSPDGNYLLVVGSMEPDGFGLAPDYDWWILPVHGGKAVPLAVKAVFTKARLGDEQWIPLPNAWLREGNRVLFDAGIGEGATNLWQLSIVPGQWRWAGDPVRLTSGTGESDPSADNSGRIVFTSATTDWDIWSLPLDANSGKVQGPLIRTVSGLGNEAYPTLSTDGRRLVYVSDRSGNIDVWLRDLTTSKDTPVTISAAYETRAAISPDGTRVAFGRREERKINIYLTDLAGRSEKKVLEGVGNIMDWMADGKTILYYTPAPLKWRTLNVETGETAPVDLQHPQYAVHDLRLSPGGDWAAFKLFIDAGRYGPMFIAPAKGDKVAPESDWIPIGDKLYNGRNWWSPNGNLLYFLSRRDGFWCIWSQRLNPATKNPIGELVAVQHLHERSVVNPAFFGYAMSADHLYLPLAEFKGNIWLADPQ